MIRISAQTELGRKKIDAMRKAIGVETMLAAIELRFKSWVDQNFRQSGIESRWAPLRPLTIMLRRQGAARGESDKPLMNTGHLREAFETKITKSTASIWLGWPHGTKGGTVDMGALAGWHHFGTAPYTIRVRNKKVLAAAISAGLQGKVSIFGPSGSFQGRGYVIFGKEVHHPGLPSRPLLPSHSLARTLVRETLQGMLDTMAQEVNRGSS